jgi:hypothetical protein
MALGFVFFFVIHKHPPITILYRESNATPMPSLSAGEAALYQGSQPQDVSLLRSRPEPSSRGWDISIYFVFFPSQRGECFAI